MFGHFPEGDPFSSPGLLYSATLGKTAPNSPTPTGLCPMLPASANSDQFASNRYRLLRSCRLRCEARRNPLGLENSLAISPG